MSDVRRFWADLCVHHVEAVLYSDYAALEAKYAELRKVAIQLEQANAGIAQLNGEMRSELAKLRAGGEPVAFKKPSLLMDCNVRYSTSTAPQPSAVPDGSRLDADDVRAACQNAIEVFADEENAEQCREVAEYMREVLLADLDRAAPSAPATVQPDPVKAQRGGWQLAADALPATGKPVLAYYLNSHGMGRRIRAMHVKRFTVEAEEFADPDTQCCEYSEQDDCYYTTEGWYELIDNWPDYASCAVIEGVITHWMPLPAAPAIAAARQEGGKV